MTSGAATQIKMSETEKKDKVQLVKIKATEKGKKHMEPGKTYSVGADTAKTLIDSGRATKV